jgi:hypothetical protein
LPGRPGQQVERPELVRREHHRRVTRTGFRLALGDVVELQRPVLLGLVVRVGRLFPGLHRSKRHPLLTEQDEQRRAASTITNGNDAVADYETTIDTLQTHLARRSDTAGDASTATVDSRYHAKEADADAGATTIDLLVRPAT